MNTAPTDVVRDFYNKLAAGDVPGAPGMMDPHIEWITMWDYIVRGRGPGAVAEGLFKPLAADWTSFSLKPSEFVYECDTVVSVGGFEVFTALIGVRSKLSTPPSGRYGGQDH
jgi:ketosteroid isomerase-like protein